jgi:hypothetical protein
MYRLAINNMVALHILLGSLLLVNHRVFIVYFLTKKRRPVSYLVKFYIYRPKSVNIKFY